MTDHHTNYIQRYNGENFHLWKRQMEIFAHSNKLIKYMDGSTPRAATDNGSWDEKDCQAQAFIMKGLELTQLKHLSRCHTAAQMWSRLNSIHAEMSDQSMQVLLEQFINCKMTVDPSRIADHIADICQLAERLKDLGMDLATPIIIAKILSSLPSVFASVRTSWYSVPKAEQKVERLTNHLANEVAGMKSRGEISSEFHAEDALFLRTRGTDVNKNNFNGAKSKRKPGSCNYCHKAGHWAKECRIRINDERNGGRSNQSRGFDGYQNGNPGYSQRNRGYNGRSQHGQGHGYMAEGNNHQRNQGGHQELRNRNFEGENNYNNESEMFCVETECFMAQKEENLWFADSAATEHMSFREDWLQNLSYYPENTYKVRMGNGEILYAKGRGNVIVKANNGYNSHGQHIIHNVLLVPKLTKNILSVNKSACKGIDVIFRAGGKIVQFMKEGNVLVNGKLYGSGLYVLQFQTILQSEANVASTPTLMIWHERLGHPNLVTLKEMITKSTVDNLKIEGSLNSETFCEGCRLGKQHRLPFPKTARRASAPGELFHMDLSGKSSQPSIGGANYFF